MAHTIEQINELLQIERERSETLRQLESSEAMSPRARDLLKEKLGALTARGLVLDPPPEQDPWAGLTVADMEAYEARSAAWREADFARSEKQRELAVKLGRLNNDPTASPGAKEAIAKELHALRYPAPVKENQP